MKHTDPHNIFRWLTPAVRTWLYGVLIAAIPLLTIYGIIDNSQAPLWVAMAGAILGFSTAAAHVPANRERELGAPPGRDSTNVEKADDSTDNPSDSARG